MQEFAEPSAKKIFFPGVYLCKVLCDTELLAALIRASNWGSYELVIMVCLFTIG